MPHDWSRAMLARSNRNDDVFPEGKSAPRNVFLASFEVDHDKPPMNLLLSWEYGRMWLIERETFLKAVALKGKGHFIAPDFNWWLKKRTVVLDRRKLFRKHPQSQQKKDTKITAFALTKERRIRGEQQLAKRITDISANQQQDEFNAFVCKDCKCLVKANNKSVNNNNDNNNNNNNHNGTLDGQKKSKSTL